MLKIGYTMKEIDELKLENRYLKSLVKDFEKKQTRIINKSDLEYKRELHRKIMLLWL